MSHKDATYWEPSRYDGIKPDISPFIEVAQHVKSRFFTMAIAQKENEDWIIMELGDRQVAGLPA
ncbi:MAG: ATP-grasp domain-containing protein [Bacteroidota bacterium]